MQNQTQKVHTVLTKYNHLGVSLRSGNSDIIPASCQNHDKDSQKPNFRVLISTN